MPKTPLTVTFPEEQIDAFDLLARALTRRAGGVPITRLDTIRAAAGRGIEIMREELASEIAAIEGGTE